MLCQRPGDMLVKVGVPSRCEAKLSLSPLIPDGFFEGLLSRKGFYGSAYFPYVLRRDSHKYYFILHLSLYNNYYASMGM